MGHGEHFVVMCGEFCFSYLKHKKNFLKNKGHNKKKSPKVENVETGGGIRSENQQVRGLYITA